MQLAELKQKNENGQSLILLLVFIVMAIAITTAATIIVGINSSSATNATIGISTKRLAESGAEKSLLALLRNPSYTGETFSLDGANITTVVTGTSPLTIDSTAVNGSVSKKVEVTATYTNNVLNIVSWKEISP